MIRIGLKLWSVNVHYAPIAKKLYSEGAFDYIELSAIPKSRGDTEHIWKNIAVPYVMHAPHFMQGLNFSDPFKEKINVEMAEETFRFADSLNAEYVIFHPGIGGDFRETARQVKNIGDGRMLIENKPYLVAKRAGGLTENDICVGWSPEQIKYILEAAGISFCLDIGHCFCAANSAGRDKYRLLKEFLLLSPKMFHLSDGDIESPIDKHYCIGQGTYDFKKIFSILPKDITLTLETEKPSQSNLDAFKNDAAEIKKAWAFSLTQK